MSDLKLYRILETFDELESAADKLTPVKEDDINKEEVDEAQTKVQTIGNKVKVTTDGDTTEFDDADTAKEFMSADDEDNQFATEDLATQGQEEIINYDDFDLPREPDSDMEIIDYKNFRPPVRNVEEGGLGGDAWDAAADDIELDNYDDTDFSVNDAPPAEFGIDADDWMDSNLDEMDDANGEPAEEVFGDWYQDDNPEDLLYDPATNTEFPRSELEEDDTEFSTFDSENESHRKRLQRGTPVVLDPELFSDPNVNRRGIFVSRSPSGHFGTVIRDFDGKEIKVHLSDIKSADLVNNSIYEEYDVNFEEMLKEETVKFSDLKVGQKFKKPNNPDLVLSKTKKNKFKKHLTKPMGGAIHFTISPDAEVIVEDITMTQTTNLENPENDTTTVTAIGPEASEELAAMMANAGLNPTNHDMMDMSASDEVDTGEPDEMPMQDMMGMMDMSPEVEEGYGRDMYSGSPEDNSDLFPTDDINWLEPSNADLDDIESDPEWDLELDDTVAETRDTEYTNTPGEQTAGVDAVLQGGGLNKPKRMYKPAGNRYGDNGMQRPMEGVDDWEQEHDDSGELPTDNYGNEIEEPTMKVVHTPDGPKWVAVGSEPADFDNDISQDVDDNMIDVPYYDEFEPELDFNEELSPKMQARKERDQAKIRADRDRSTRSKDSRLTGTRRGTGKSDGAFRLGESEDNATPLSDNQQTFVNEHENVDNFLSLYKAFSIRGEKK